MHKTILSALCFLLILPAFSQKLDYSKLTNHPRLLMTHGEEVEVMAKLQDNPDILRLHHYLLQCSDSIIDNPTLSYEKQGMRLLAVSREAFRRIFYLSYTYRMTNERKYALRAEQEMIAVCSFDDWNPSHFLDAGEMTMAVAIGYDWLFDELSSSTKKLAKNAIINNGFEPSKVQQYNNFLRASNNWNQVCNSGLVYGALALLDEEPEYAQEIIERALTTVDKALKIYAPDGVYPEGYIYWGYGTTFQVLLSAALESALGSDAGLSDAEGFFASTQYMQFMVGKSGKCFNFSDSRENPLSLPAMYWFANKTQDASLLWNEKLLFNQEKLSFSSEETRFLPLIPIYGAQFKMDELSAPTTKIWTGNGRTPVVLIRTEWEHDDRGFYLGIKGGKATTSHGHMDAGSFVFDALGLRWAQDLGLQEYYSLEKEKVNIWNSSQDGQRWDVFRYNNFAHNTLTVNGKKHVANGFVPITEVYSDSEKLGASLDMTELFGGELASAQREIALIDEQYLSIIDQLKAGDAPSTVRWTMVTSAKPKVINDHLVELHQEGKCARLTIQSLADVRLSVLDNASENSYDAPNEGTCRIAIDIQLESGQEREIRVRLIPIRLEQSRINVLNLEL
ncbi:MAG: heparinase II/III family protein [Mangrovibacterium sp.]